MSAPIVRPNAVDDLDADALELWESVRRGSVARYGAGHADDTLGVVTR